MSSMKEQLVVPPEAVDAVLREIQKGRLPDVEKFSQTYHFPPSTSVDNLVRSCKNRHGDTPFLIAARHGQVELLKTLHDKIAVPLYERNMDGKTALHEAAQHGQVSSAHYLIEAGIDVDCLKRADWLVDHGNVLCNRSQSLWILVIGLICDLL